MEKMGENNCTRDMHFSRMCLHFWIHTLHLYIQSHQNGLTKKTIGIALSLFSGSEKDLIVWKSSEEEGRLC